MKDYKPFLISSIVVLTFWISAFYFIPKLSYNPEVRGQIGDSFGLLNTLFSGLAFAGIIATIIMQRKELQLQREELELTRKELKKSAEAQDASQRALNLQVQLMTKQAILNAYQTSFSNNLNLLTSKFGTNEQRGKAQQDNTQLLQKIEEIIKDIESTKNSA